MNDGKGCCVRTHYWQGSWNQISIVNTELKCGYSDKTFLNEGLKFKERTMSCRISKTRL